MNTQPPMMRQYLALKREAPKGSLLLFRLGDFYEMFGDDALAASPILRAPLTTRGDTPMCGFPVHAIDSCLAKFIRNGKTVALADYAEDTRSGKLTRREITRVIAPGT